LDSLFQSKVALMRLELLQLVDVRVEEASRPLREELAALNLLLARAGDSSEPMKACTSCGPELASAQALFPHDSAVQKSSVVEEDNLYGSVSPRGSPCLSPQPSVSPAFVSEDMAGILAPVLQITPELHELREEDSVELPLELGSFEASAVAPMPSPPQKPASMFSEEVLAHSSEALFGTELCGLLASLEVASPGYGKDIACVLAGKASEDMIRMMEKSLRKVSVWGKRRKKRITKKFSAAT
jgi:hypothetical protein